MRNLWNRIRNWFNTHSTNTTAPNTQRSNNGFQRYFVRPMQRLAFALVIGTICCLVANYFLMQQPELYNVCPEFFDILKGYVAVYRYILYSGSKIIVSIFEGNFFKVTWEMIKGWGNLFQQFWAWFSSIQF